MLLVLLAMSIGGAACVGQDGSVEGLTASSIPGTVAAPAGDVTLTGRVTAAPGEHVFVLGSGAEQVIVVMGRPPQVAVGDDLEVTGQVRTFRQAELEAELAVDLGPEVSHLEGSDCLVATAAGPP